MKLVVDKVATAIRRATFEEYMTAAVASRGDGLVCQWAPACSASAGRAGADFYGGQLGHVGSCYDLAVGGRALRLLVIGQEFGRKPDSIPIGGRATGAGDVVTVEERHADLVGFRGGQSFTERNAHMRGTSLAVRTVLESATGDSDPGASTDREGEFFRDDQGVAFHMFDAFAFTNMLLCSANLPGRTKGVPTVEMRRNCRRHLQETIRLLEPTVVVVQKAPTVAFTPAWLGPLVRNKRRPGRSSNLWRAEVGGVETLLVVVNHPSAGNANVGWQWPTFPYWADVVRPALIETGQLLPLLK